MIEGKKGSILLVLKTLEEYSDEEHYLTQQEIADKIYQNYGIELERKNIASSLSILSDLDYDINKGARGGFALLSRNFDQSEACFLIDAIFSSRSINGANAKLMAKHVSSCFSKYQRTDYSYVYKSNEITRTDSKETLFNISLIHEAMNQGKRVGFNYLSYGTSGNKITRNNNFEYIVSPYYIINSFGRYYLLCNYREKYRPLQVFRIDYMTNIKIKDDWPIKRMENLQGLPKGFSITSYLNDHVYLLNGNVIDATIELDDENCVSMIKDWFGDRASICLVDGKIRAEARCDENALYYWLLQYSDCAKAVAPRSLVERVKEGLRKALGKYEHE